MQGEPVTIIPALRINTLWVEDEDRDAEQSVALDRAGMAGFRDIAFLVAGPAVNVVVRPKIQGSITVGRFAGIVVIGLVCSGLGTSHGSADSPPQEALPQPMLIGDLEPKLDGKEVTVIFTMTALEGIAQLAKEGQAPSFAMETDSGKQKNVLSVWIEGELANVLDRLQMGYLQDNQLKAGTKVIATGKLTLHKLDSHLFFLSVTEWKGFRVLPTKEEK